jgi:hypothetical protein
MPKIDFTDAREKLKRAREHVDNLATEINAYLGSDFYKLRMEPNQRSPEHVDLIFDSLHEPSKRVNVILGDAINNLRSTLDYIAIALIAPITGDIPEIGWPFADDANSWKGKVGSARFFGPCDRKIVDVLLDEIQTYESGNGHRLWVLNKLRNIDQHRLLITAAVMPTILLSFVAGSMVFEHTAVSVHQGQSCPFLTLPKGAQIDFTEEPEATFYIILREPPYISEVHVFDFLQSVSSQVESILHALEVFL